MTEFVYDSPIFWCCSAPEKDDLIEILERVYLPPGVETWLQHAANKGWTYEESLEKARVLERRDG